MLQSSLNNILKQLKNSFMAAMEYGLLDITS